MKKFTFLIIILTLAIPIVKAQECVTPTGFEVMDITTNSASLSWDEVTTGDEVNFYQICIVPGTGEAVQGPTSTTTTAPSYFPLTPDTEYTAYVRSFCSGTWSTWSAGSTFTTLPCLPATFPYLVDFEGITAPEFPECTSAPDAVSGSNWIIVNNPGNGFTTNTLQYTGTTEAADAWFFTRGVELIAGTYYQINFDYGNNSDVTIEGFAATYGTGQNADSANLLFEADELIGGVQQNANLNFFTVTETAVYYFGFHAISAANQGNIYIDNFNIEPASCSIPANLQINDATQTEATLSWLPGTGGNTDPLNVYQYAYGTTDSPPAMGTMGQDLIASFDDLEAGTTYYAFVRALCGPVWSDWAIIEFTTQCNPATVPYLLDFETATLPGLPECTAQETSGENWISVNNPGNGFENNTLVYSGIGEGTDAWFFTQGITLTAGTYYKISYTFGNNGDSTVEGFSSHVATAQDSGEVLGQLAEHTGIEGGAEVNYTFDSPFSVQEDGVYYFAFHALTNADQESLYLDNIAVEEWSCGEPQDIAATDITSETATINWTAPEENTTMGYFFAYSTVNATPDDFELITDTTVDLSGLEANTTYYVFIMSMCGPLSGEWTVTEFTTEEILGTSDNNFSSFSYYPNPVSSVINISNNTVIESVKVYNITGQLVYSNDMNSTEAVINIEKLPAGVYMLSAYVGDTVKTIKIMKN